MEVVGLRLVSEVPHPGGVTNLSIQSLFFLDGVHMLGGVPYQGGYLASLSR